VTYNSNRIIKKCIVNLLKYNDIGSELEIIIVDNSHHTVFIELKQLLQANYDKRIRIVKNNKNGGYGQGNNLGVLHAVQSKLICIMNPDVILTQPLFKKSLENFNRGKHLGMLGFKQYGGANISFYMKPEYYMPLASKLLTKIFNKSNLFFSKYMYLSGAFLFIDSKKFKEIGCFDEGIFLYCEEPDISMRLQNKGWKIKYDSSLSYIHEVGDRNEFSEFTVKTILNSRKYYFNKYDLSFKFHIRKNLVELQLIMLVSILFKNSKKLESIKKHILLLKNKLKEE
jgi:GT2 family glycosyltransferase